MASHLSHEEFFTSLTDLLSKTSQKSHGSVYLTQKPLLPPTQDQDGSSISLPSMLIRATDGKTSAPSPTTKTNTDKSQSKSASQKTRTPKVKISTVVALEELEAFYTRYAEICKAGMSGLKKKQRKKRSKAKGGAGKVTKS
ncbi:hypothetical protein MPDQ_006004 [Monascus purpureus]|uniref:Signal recognition particle subunit SRP14 n=1 Tax=Monascus purpureus TaxID=5098 RepID=A0A507QYR2_MONPU|nr:hypothetical protein MPDQ_006004 [Monascus purpureus]